jgi:hypothetical protein
MTRSRVRFQFVPIALWSIVALSGSAAGTAAADQPTAGISAASPGPVITGAACTDGALLVTGEGFTPGGHVDLEIAGSDDTLRASQPVFGPNGSMDPALGYQPGRPVDFENAEEAMIYPVRATWSTFGPNGSIDPANGYQPGGYFGVRIGYDCTETAVVRAYDRQLATWSDHLPVLAGRGSEG